MNEFLIHINNLFIQPLPEVAIYKFSIYNDNRLIHPLPKRKDI